MRRASVPGEGETKWQLAGAQGCRDLAPVGSAIAHRRQCRCLIAFGQAPAVGMSHQRVVEIVGLGEAEQLLEQALHGG